MTGNDWNVPSNWEKRPVCVLGGGVLGRRIAACFVAAGHHVRIRDPSKAALQQALDYLKTDIKAYTALTRHQAGSYEATEDLAAGVKDCWVVFEAVPEVLKIKEDTYADLEKLAPKDCILASNSSSYKSGDLLGKVQDETKVRVLNTHFMMPPEAIIVELMTSGFTSDAIFPFLTERMKEAGLHPVTALVQSSGFIFNRLWAAIKREVMCILAEGVATPETIDKLWIEQYVGRKQGPYNMMDEIGLDTVEHIEQHYITERDLPSYHLDWLKQNYISAGKLGHKAQGKGGLYPPVKEGTRTKVLLLNVGLAEPLQGKSPQEIMHSGQVLAYDVEEKKSRPVELIGHAPLPDGIDVSNKTTRMYWTNMGNPKANDGSVQSANLDGSDVQYVLPTGQAHTPKQLIIDQENDKIYFTDREGLTIRRCNLDGSQVEVLYKSGSWQTEASKKADATYWPVGITISHKLKKFFWTQKGHSKGGEGRIFSAGLDFPAGASPFERPDIEVVQEGLPECIDLEFDDEAGVLYWTDRGDLPLGNTLNKKTLIGAVPEQEKALGRQIIAQGLGEGIGLRLDRERQCLYVADLGGRLWRCKTDGSELKEKLFEDGTHAYTGVAFYRY